MDDIVTLVQTARYEALHGSAIGCAGLVKNLADAVAALTAENERLVSALTEAIAHVEGKGAPSIRLQGVPRALQIPLAALDRWRAALPSSRESTDGRTDPS